MGAHTRYKALSGFLENEALRLEMPCYRPSHNQQLGDCSVCGKALAPALAVQQVRAQEGWVCGGGQCFYTHNNNVICSFRAKEALA